MLMSGYPYGFRLQKEVNRGDYYEGKRANHEVFLTYSKDVPLHLGKDDCFFVLNGIGYNRQDLSFEE